MAPNHYVGMYRVLKRLHAGDYLLENDDIIFVVNSCTKTSMTEIVQFIATDGSLHKAGWDKDFRSGLLKCLEQI